MGNAADIHLKLVKRGIIPDIVTDQTPAHKLELYIPVGDVKEMETLLEENPEEYRKRAYESIKKHAEALLQMQKQGAILLIMVTTLENGPEKQVSP